MVTQSDIDYMQTLCLKGDIHQMDKVKLTTNFTLGEFFKGIPPNKFKECTTLHLVNIFNTATILQSLRNTIFDNRVVTISPQGGWRDKATQKKLVKKGVGATKSQHLLGNAADINVQGWSAKEVQKKLFLADCKYTVGLGTNFTHIDRRTGIGVFTYK